MAELDLLSAEGFVEEPLGPLYIRRAAVQPPAHPLGPDYSEPHFGIFASAKHRDRGWICLFATPTPDRALETLYEDSLARTERLSILVGSSWAAIAGSARTVAGAQESAVQMLPPAVYSADPEQLRALRDLIKNNDPAMVAMLCQMTFHWGLQRGGTHGPEFAG